MIKLLAQYMKDIDWKILLSMNDKGKFNIILLPIAKVKDEALKDMKPVMINDLTLDELDSITSESLNKAMATVQSVVSNVADFEKDIAEREKLTKMVKLKREQAKNKKEADKKIAKESAPSMFEASKVPETVEETVEEEVSLDI